MKVAIIGASGHLGAEITQEALSRGHLVTGISRNIGVLPEHPQLRRISIDVYDVAALAQGIKESDVVIHAFSPGRGRTDPDIFEKFVAGHEAILAAVKQASIARLLCVGGAASLKTRDDVPLIDSREWPTMFDQYKDGIRGTRELYYLLQKTSDVDWIFLAPSIMLTDGARTGAYRVGKDHVLYEPDGQSRISTSDFALAMIDELERPAHHRERFTVGY